jgi:DNA-binding transcriptional regulator YdaS (Cro superfamily)
MNLLAYVKEERGRGAAIAAAVGVHPVMVSQWATGAKPVPVDRCAAIDKATGGKVTRRDLRPLDWHEHWPELVNAEHPAPAAEPVAQGS